MSIFLILVAFMLFMLNLVVLLVVFMLYALCTVMAVFCHAFRRHADDQRHAIRWLIRLIE